jgi:uncharacterized protein (TIGR02594 family)
MDDARWLIEAWREFGERERPGSAENPRIVALFRDAGHASVTKDETAWCAAFCGACLERAGIRSTRSLMARSYLEWGARLDVPRMGAIAVFSRGSDPALGHVGFYLGEAGSDVVLLGGNQGNAVSVTRYPKSRLLALRWPAPDAESARDEPVAKPATADVFARALAHVLEMEGGYTDDPHDPGGPTNRGITLQVFAAWRNVTLSPANRDGLIRDLKAIDAATVAEIYRRRYWEPAGAADLAAPLALMHFDAAVNHGVGTAFRCLQEAVGADVDGEIGPETKAAIAKTPTATALARYADIRRRRYRALPHSWRFGRGWLARVDATLAAAKALATDPQNSSSEGDQDMTTISNDGKWWGHSLTIWGTLVTILSTVVPALAPVTGVDLPGDLVQDAGTQVIDAVQAVGALVGTLMTIYGRFRATSPLQKTLLKSKG